MRARMKITSFDFPFHYDVETLDHLPQAGADYTFVRPQPSKPVEGLILDVPNFDPALVLKVTTGDAATWTGAFDAGFGGISGIYATPSPDTLCVTVQGEGYWVPTLHPKGFGVIQAVPVKRVLRVPDSTVLLFVDFIRIVAYGANGFLWVTRRLSWDGLTITEVTTRHVRGLGWDSPANCEVPFVVDVDTGEFEGGSSPEHYAHAN